MPGPQISLGTKVMRNFFSDFLPNIVKFSPIFSPNLGEDQKKKRSSLKFCPIFSHEECRPDQKILTWEPKLFRAPLGPGPGTMYPLNPPLVGPGSVFISLMTSAYERI